MNNSSGNQDGDLGIIYKEQTVPLTEGTNFKKIIFKRTFTLSEPIPSETYYYLEGYGTDTIHSAYESIHLSSSSLELGEGAGLDDANTERWTSEDGQTYTWVDTYEDWDTMETITKEWKGYKEYDCSITINSEYSNWTDLFGEIFSITSKEYHGLYKFQQDDDPQYIMSFKNIKTELYEEEESDPFDPDYKYTVTKVKIKSYDTVKVDVEDLYNRAKTFINSFSSKYGIYIINRNSNTEIESISKYTSSNATYLFMDENNHLWISTSWDSGTPKAYSFTKNTYNLGTGITNTETIMSSWKEFGSHGWYYKLIEDITDKEIILLNFKSDTSHLITNSVSLNQIYQDTTYTDTVSTSLKSFYAISSKWFIAENQFNLKDPNLVIGNYKWLGPEDEVSSQNTWASYINEDKFKEIIPYFDTQNRLGLGFYYGYNKMFVPGGHLLVPANLKHITRDNLIQDYLYDRDGNNIKYGYRYDIERSPKIDLNNVPNISACNGYLYQMSDKTTINNNIATSIIYGPRSNYAYFIQINLLTNTVITKKSIQLYSQSTTYGSANLVYETDTYWVIAASPENEGSIIMNSKPSKTFVVINKSNGTKQSSFTYTCSTAGSCYSWSFRDVTFNGNPSSSTIDAMIWCKYYNSSSSTYSWKLYRVKNGSASELCNFPSSTTDLSTHEVCNEEVIISYRENSSSSLVTKMFYPINKIVYSLKQIKISVDPLKYRYSYANTDIPDTQIEGRYVIYNNQEIPVSDLDVIETVKVDNVQYLKNDTLGSSSDIDYNGIMVKADDGTEVEIAIPSDYYELTSRNNYQYETPWTLKYDSDSDHSGSSTTYSYYVQSSRYVFTSCELKPITTLEDATDNLVMIQGHSDSTTTLEDPKTLYQMTKIDIDKLINN